MWIYDRDTLCFLAVNAAAINHYGYSREEFLSMTLKDIRPPEDIPLLLEKISDVKPGVNSASARHIKKDRTVFPVEIVSHTLQFRGKRAELVLAMDVSPRRNLQNEHDPLNASVEFNDAQLTAAETRVALCVARGYSNKQIAAELRVSVRTVENQISRILMKKSFVNRVELARFVIERTRPRES
jgi:PAS domain S-box-containing protein